MKKTELKELYKMMFPDYPDIVTVKQLREMLGISPVSYTHLSFGFALLYIFFQFLSGIFAPRFVIIILPF